MKLTVYVAERSKTVELMFVNLVKMNLFQKLCYFCNQKNQKNETAFFDVLSRLFSTVLERSELITLEKSVDDRLLMITKERCVCPK